MIYLWDTNTAVFYLNGEKTVLERMMAKGEENVAICEIVKGELIFGAALGKKKDQNLKKLEGFFEEVQFLPLIQGCGDIYAQIKLDLRKKGKPISGNKDWCDDNDVWIASIAIYHGATLVSNENNFKYIEGLQLEDWK